MIVYTVFYTYYDDHPYVPSDDSKEELVDLFLSYYDASTFVREHIDYVYKAVHNEEDAYFEFDDVDSLEVMQPTCVNGHNTWKFIKGYARKCMWGDEVKGLQAYLIYQKNVSVNRLASE